LDFCSASKFDEAGLALLFQEKTKDGEVSVFNKLVSRETAETRSESQGKYNGTATAERSSPHRS
jgi:hypothetical protein